MLVTRCPRRRAGSATDENDVCLVLVKRQEVSGLAIVLVDA